MPDRQRDWLERAALPIFAVLGAVALAAHAPLLLSVSLVLAALDLLGRLWRRFGLRRVAYERRFIERRLFPGERTTMTIRVTNGKLLPLPWLTITESFDDGLCPPDRVENARAWRRRTVTHSFTLGPFEQVERQTALLATRRGCYRLPAVEAAAGDPFGLYRGEGKLGTPDEVLVYPTLLEPSEYAPPAQQPFGERPTRRSAIPDPFWPAGARPYHAGDPLRLVHWRASARLGALQSRRFDPAATLRLMIILDVNTATQPWHGVDHALAERAISLVASLARDALEAGTPVGLLANALMVNSDQMIRIPAGRSPGQLAAILESLARLVLYFGRPIAEVLELEAPRLPFGATLALVSVIEAEETDLAVAHLQRRNHPVVRYDPRGPAVGAVASG